MCKNKIRRMLEGYINVKKFDIYRVDFNLCIITSRIREYNFCKFTQLF